MPIAAALLVLAGLLQSVPTAPVGTISGRVVLSASMSSRKMRFRLYSDFGPGAVVKPQTVDTGEMVNVVIYLDTAAYTKYARESFIAEKSTIERLGMANKGA